MAKVGFRKIYIAKRTAAGTYEKPFKFGKAINLSVSPQYAEGTLYADDALAEEDKEFKYADVTLGTNTIPAESHTIMFGHKVDESGEITHSTDDQGQYVGQGWLSVERVDGVRSFVANFLKKVKFTEPSEEYETKGDSIAYKTPSISGKAMAEEDGSWKAAKPFATEEEALTWLFEKFGAENTEPEEQGETE